MDYTKASTTGLIDALREQERHPETYDRVTAFLRGLLPSPDLGWRSYESYEAISP